jgi:hypothetical protein
LETGAAWARRQFKAMMHLFGFLQQLRKRTVFPY